LKRILLISYFYPPLGGPGVQRPSKLVKYLNKHDVLTDVITVKDIVFHSKDYKLLKEDKASNIVRTASFDPMYVLKKFSKPQTSNKVYFKTPEKYKKLIRLIFPIDEKIGWLPFVLKAGKKLFKLYRYDAVMATIGPYTSAIAAFKLAKYSKLPLIIDYRDHWTLNPYITFASKLHKKNSAKWEKRILKYSTVVSVVSNTMKNDIVQQFGGDLTSKLTVMYNGWDEDDFSNFVLKRSEQKILRYIGNFYGHRTLKYFIQALEKLQSVGKLPKDVIFEFTGNYYTETLDLIKNSTVSHIIRVNPQVEHKEAINLLMNCDALLLFIASYKGEGVITGKLFEYLRSNKRVLAMVPPDGEAAKILRENDQKLICAMEDKNNIAKNLIELMQNPSFEKRKQQVSSEYSREGQTIKFKEFVETKISERSKKIKICHIQLLPLLTGAQNVMLKILSSLDKEKYKIYVISKPGGPLTQKVKELGYNYIPIRTFRRDLSIFDIFAFFKLIKIFKQYKFDIVHTHSSKPGFLGRLAAKLCNIPRIIHTVHGFPFHSAQPKLVRVFYQHLEKLVSSACDKVVFVNNSEREIAIRKKIVKEDKAVTIFNGIEIPKFQIHQEHEDIFTIGCVLRFEKIKNIIETVKAAIKVSKQNDKIVFYFVGDGSLLDECKQIVAIAGQENNILFPGWQNNISEWLAKFDVYLLYSIAEGLSISILEAMSMKLPIVASNVKGNEELVSDENGILVPINDIDRLSKVLLSLPDKKEELKQWGENSYKIVKEKFSYSEFVRKYNALYS